MTRLSALFLLINIIGMATLGHCQPLTIETVLVSDIGNPPNLLNGRLIGAVDYEYRIGKYEINNAQYVVFLNSVAASDPLGLYNDAMAYNRGGILRSGASGNFTYTSKPNMGNKPVNIISWVDAMRFVNWLHNGQPIGPQGAGTTETGAYTLLGFTRVPSNSNLIRREPNAKWSLPSNSEWYKAAFYNPATGSYFTYATSSDVAPTMATANAVGDVINSGPNVANYGLAADWDGENGHLTTVGSAAALSPYGTYDQAGNVSEFTDHLPTVATAQTGEFYGSSFMSMSPNAGVGGAGAAVEQTWLGFRIARPIPEPSTAILVLLGGAAFLSVGARSRRHGYQDRETCGNTSHSATLAIRQTIVSH